MGAELGATVAFEAAVVGAGVAVADTGAAVGAIVAAAVADIGAAVAAIVVAGVADTGAAVGATVVAVAERGTRVRAPPRDNGAAAGAIVAAVAGRGTRVRAQPRDKKETRSNGRQRLGRLTRYVALRPRGHPTHRSCCAPRVPDRWTTSSGLQAVPCLLQP